MMQKVVVEIAQGGKSITFPLDQEHLPFEISDQETEAMINTWENLRRWAWTTNFQGYVHVLINKDLKNRTVVATPSNREVEDILNKLLEEVVPWHFQ